MNLGFILWLYALHNTFQFLEPIRFVQKRSPEKTAAIGKYRPVPHCFIAINLARLKQIKQTYV